MVILKDYDYRKIPIETRDTCIRDNLLVTAGARAGYMDMRDDIDIPGDLAGEDRLAEVVVKLVDDYLDNDYGPFDIYVEDRLNHEFGRKEND